MFKSKKQTSMYKLTLKRNLIYEYCCEQYNNSSSCDLFFFCSERVIGAHAAIIGLSSRLLKQLEPRFSAEYSVYLPDYAFSTVESFVKFLYTGELMIHEAEYPDFQSLCKELLVDLPEVVCEGYNVPPAEELVHEMLYEEAHVDAPIEEPNKGDDCVKMETEVHPMSEIPAKSRPPKPKDSSDTKNLHAAIEAIQSARMNTLQAAKRFGIPKTTLYRWINRNNQNMGDSYPLQSSNDKKVEVSNRQENEEHANLEEKLLPEDSVSYGFS